MNLLKQVLTSAFNIRDGEGRLTALLFVHSFCLGTVTVSFSTAASALFLTAFDVGMLPYVYIGSAGMAVLIGLIYTRLQARLPFAALLVITLGFVLLTVAGFRLGLALSDSKWLIFSLLFWLRLVIVLANLEFWGLAGRLFDIRQGKRLFSLIGSGELSASILGGFATPAFVMGFGTQNLLWVSVAGLVVSVGILLAIIRSYGDQLALPADGSSVRERPAREGVGERLKHPYTLMIILSNALMIVVYSFVDFIFYDYTQARFQGEMKLAMFIGPFFAVVQIINVLTKTFLASRLFNRYGLKFGLFAHPALLIVLSLGIAATHQLLGTMGLLFWLVAVMKLCDEVLWTSIYDPSLLILYQPLRAGQRRSTQVAVQSIFGPLATAVAGIGLLLLGAKTSFTSVQLTYVIPLILVGAVIVARRVSREYPVTLTQALAKRTLGEIDFSLRDGASLAVVQQKIQSPNPREVHYALDLLEQSEHESFTATLTRLLDHPEVVVRSDVLTRLGRIRATEALDAVAERLEMETSPEVKAAALRAVCALGESEVVETVSPYLDASQAELHHAAMVGLLRDGGLAGVLVAGERLMRASRSPEIAQRVGAAQVLHDVGLAQFYQPLLSLLTDTEPLVCRAALDAAGQVRHPKVWPVVLDHIVQPDMGVHIKNRAACALVAGGEAVLPLLQTTLSNPDTDREVRLRLTRICGQIGGERAIAILRDAMHTSDAAVRQSVLSSLGMSHYRATARDVAHIEQLFKIEGTMAASLLAAWVDIGAHGQDALVRAATSRDVYQVTRRLFDLLSFVADSKSMRRAWDAIAHANTEKRAYALEVVDVLAPPKQKAILLPLIEAPEPAARLRRLQAQFPQSHLGRMARLEHLVRQPGHPVAPWTRACAIYSMVTGPDAAHAETLEAAQCAPEALVRDTARWALNKITPEPVAERQPMALSIIEKVIILKTVHIFCETPDDVLADIATILDEIEVGAGEVIFEKGDVGRCMYVIVDGEVRVHDGERTLAHLRERQIFGELAVLDPEPRSASVTAIEPTRLFSLDQDAFYDLMADHIEIARGIIRALCQDLRTRTSSQ